MKHPLRRIRFSDLNHRSPEWLNAPIFFITICTKDRGSNYLCGSSFTEILRSIQIYHEKEHWFCHVALLMPDHVHFLLSFKNVATYPKVVGGWKRWISRHHEILWQENFFEHRLREEESFDEKADYILRNPLRAGLITSGDQWPYMWMPG